MTTQEAIKILKINCICSPHATEFIESAKLAQEALEKQIPKTPLCVLNQKPQYGLNIGECPFCNTTVSKKKNNFCGKCGQALDWSDELKV